MDVPDIVNPVEKLNGDPLCKSSELLASHTNDTKTHEAQLENEDLEYKSEDENPVQCQPVSQVESIDGKAIEDNCIVIEAAINKTENTDVDEKRLEDKSNEIDKLESSDISPINGNSKATDNSADEPNNIVKSEDWISSKHNSIAVKKQFKKRRRIIITESNSEPESENDFNQPEPEPESDPTFDCSQSENQDSSSEEEEEEEEIFVSEKPKPKCKKQSTIIKKQLEIKKLLENAIIIPAPPIKCNISRAVISSSDEKEDEDKRICKTSPILLRCNKRKLFESSSSQDSESDSNILITEPIPEATFDKYELDDEPISAIVLPPDLETNVHIEAEAENEHKDVTANGYDIHEDKMIFSSATGSEEDASTKRMPNSVYFGDVEVPLNVLYSYEEENEIKSASVTNESSDESDSEVRTKRNNNNNRNNQTRGHAHKSIGSSRNLPSARSELDKLKACVKAANIKIKYTQLFEDCTNDRERADAIRDLLEDHGLRGEPTIAKCRRLKKKVVKVKKEIADLDKSAIIESSGRTLRSAGVVHKSENFPDLYGQELLKRTMNTIRNLVDTDSD